MKLSKKFNRTEKLLDLPPKPKNERETHIVVRIRVKILFTEDPSLSIRKSSVHVGISYSLCRYVILKDLRLKPYKCQSAHQLLPLDYEKKVFFSECCLGLVKSAYKWLWGLCYEAYFNLTESINKQNLEMLKNFFWSEH